MPLSTADLDRIAAELAAAEDRWLQAQAAVNETLPCPECNGRGSVAQGSLGDYCVTCDGTGTMDSILDDDPVEFPPELAALRDQYHLARGKDERRERALAAGKRPPPPAEGDVADMLAKIKAVSAQAKLAAKGKVQRAAQPLLDAKDREIADLKRRLAAAKTASLSGGDESDVEDLNRED